MAHEPMRHLFFRCKFAACITNTLFIDMKKILLLIAMTGVLMGAISCSDDDEPKRGDGVFTVNTAMVNHMVQTGSDAVIGISSTHNKLVIDTVKHKASLELNYNDSTHNKLVIDTVKHKASLELNYNDGQGDKQLKLDDLTATPKRLGFYVLTSASYGSFSGYVDFNEGSMRYSYTTTGGIRVISTTPEVFFLKTENTITYDDTTKSNTMENVMYQFDIAPASNSAIVKVMGIVHAKDVKYFNSITATNVPITVTPNGYTISGENLKTSAYYRTYVDSTGSDAVIGISSTHNKLVIDTVKHKASLELNYNDSFLIGNQTFNST